MVTSCARLPLWDPWELTPALDRLTYAMCPKLLVSDPVAWESVTYWRSRATGTT